MRAELPVFSFLPIFLFVLVLPGQVKSTSIPAISIISWLITCSIIHGTNSILWAGNVDVHAPIWCDIGQSLDYDAVVLYFDEITLYSLRSNIGRHGRCARRLPMCRTTTRFRIVQKFDDDENATHYF